MRTLKIISIFIGLILINSICFAKSDRAIDSLLSLLKREGADKVKLNNDIAEALLQKNDSFLLKYVDPTKIHYKDKPSTSETIRSYKILGKYYLQNYHYSTAINYFLIALTLSEAHLQKADISIQLAKTLIESEEYIEALEHLRQAKTYLLNETNENLKYQTYYYEGLCYFYLEDFYLAQQRWNKAEQLSQSLYSHEFKAEINRALGELNMYTNNYYNAFNYLNLSLQILKNDSVSTCYAYALKNIGDLYCIQNNYIEAKQYYDAASTIFELKNNTKGLAEILIEQGNLALYNNEIREAFNYFDAAKNTFEKIACRRGIIKTYKGMAVCLRTNGDFKQAKQFISIANNYTQNNFSDLLIADVKLEFSTWFLQKQVLDSALYYANSALPHIKKTNNFILLSQCYSQISDIMFGYKNYKASIIAFRKSVSIKDTIYSIIHSQEYKYLQSKYEVERKQSVIAVLTQEKNTREATLKLNRLTIERQKAFILLSIIILAFLVIIAFILAAWLHQKKVDNKVLHVSNKRIAQQKEEIEVQKQHLQEINTELERLSIIARETDNGVKIMNPVGRIIWVNEGFTRLYGYTLNDMQLIDNMSLLGSQASVDISSLVSVWYGDKKPISFESKNKKKNGDDIWVQTTLTPILDQNNRISKMIAIDSDITKLKKAEAEIITKNMDITASISYAKKIQEAIMLPIEKLANYFPESFCFYQPKSIVSGDFYWFSEQHDRVVIACADSTGHGVPGAFMSLIGISFLNKIVNEKGFVSPSIILNRMRNNVITHLHHSKNDSIAGDGMDMAIITVDKKNLTLEYAGAMNPLYIIRNGDLIELKPDRMPVGFFDNEDRPFSSTNMALKTGDHIYMFTDGFYDQFGGTDDSKLKTVKFKALLKSCYNKKAAEQRIMVERYFNKWKGNNPQVDDILVMGIIIE